MRADSAQVIIRRFVSKFNLKNSHLLPISSLYNTVGLKVAHPGKYENFKDTKIMESFDLDTPSSGKHFEHL